MSNNDIQAPRVMIKPFLIILLLLSTTLIRAQLNPHNLSQYTEFIGTTIFDVLADQRGQLWLATINGLVQYDGYEYKYYVPDQNDSTTIGEILTYCLLEDRQGNIWIGGQKNIYRYNPTTRAFKSFPFKHLTDFPENGSSSIFTITSDNQGRIYFGISSITELKATHALVYYHPEEDLLRVYEFPDNLDPRNIYHSTSDPFGNVWFIALDGIFKIDSEQNLILIDHLQEMSFNDKEFWNGITSDSAGIIWVTSNESKLYAYDPSSTELRSWSMDQLSIGDARYDSRIELEVDAGQNLWIGSSEGLIHFDRTKEQFEIFASAHDKNLEKSQIRGLFIDTFRNLWIATLSNSLLKYNNKAVLHSMVPNDSDASSLPPGWVSNLFLDSQGKVWASLSSYGNQVILNRLDLKTKTTTHKFKLPWNRYSIIAGELEPNQVLIQSSERFIYHTQKNTLKRFSLKGINDWVTRLYHDSRENIWFCTNSGLFLKEKEGNGIVRYFNLTTIPGSSAKSNIVKNVYESKKHGLWLQTNDGLFLFDYETDTIQRHAFDKKIGDILSSQNINSFYEDPEGIAWVGTWQGGLCRYDPEKGKVKTYTINDGLPSMAIQGILADEKNQVLWLSTFHGLSRFNLADEQFNNFSLEDGIHGLTYGDNTSLNTPEGLFLFGGNNGISLFDPDEFIENSHPPLVFLKDFRVGNESMYVDLDLNIRRDGQQIRKMTLKYHQNDISLDYLGIQFDNPQNNKFEYLLKNYDDDWRQVGNQRTAYYQNIPPGEYVFQLKAANSNGFWSDIHELLKLTILPPWWLTWWAKILYLITAVTSIFGYIQWRTYSLRKRQKELEQTVTERTAEVVAQKEVIQKEMDRSEELLLNILPSETAEELKQYGSTKAQNYDTVTVLFTDFKGFTQHSERMSPEELVAELDHCFKAFDLIMEQYNVEKIKTIGDAYMAAAGLPTANTSNPVDAVKAALAVRDFMLQYKSELETKSEEAFEIRIGVHTGPVVAGIVGIRKFAYDIWGDTVNLASRMESSGEVGRVNVSQSTYKHLRDHSDFNFMPRGKIKAKNKGEIEMYFVENRS